MTAIIRGAFGERELTLLLLCLAAGVAFASLSPVYLAPGNLTAVLRNSVELLLIGLGITLLLAMGGIDVTVGVVLGLAAIAIGNLLLAGASPWLAAAAGPVVGLTLGLVTGVVVVFGRIPAIVATIGLLGVYRTLIFVVLGGSWLSGLPPTLGDIFTARLFGIVPMSLIVIAAVYAMAYLALRTTPFGLHLLAIGNNEERARLSGVAVKRVRLAGYAISGALCGVAAVFYVATYRNVEMTVGSTLALDAIAAVVLGGTSIQGGRASLSGTALGVFLIRILQNGFTIIGLPSLWQPVVTGALLLGSLLLERGVIDRLGRSRMSAP
jgi:ribose/xylose/arabinose/galactoside ABC-type transport system permease subunit